MADKKISALTAATTPLAGTEVLPIVQSSSTVKVSVSNLTAGRAVSASSVTTTGEVSTSGALRVAGSYSTNAASQLALQNSSGVGGMYINGATTGSANRGTFVMWLQDSAGSNYLQALGVDVSANITFNSGNLIQGTAAKGVNFTANTPAAGMTSQLLNWYETGTWTPSVSALSGTITTVGSVIATYTRVGNLVTLNAYIPISNNGTGAGALVIGSLPFTPSTTISIYSGQGLNDTTGKSLTVYCQSNNLYVRYYDATYPVASGQVAVITICYPV